MDHHTLRLLEFAEIQRLLAEQTVTALGRERALAWLPSRDPQEVARWQRETAEAAHLLDQEGQLPFGGVRDVRRAVDAAARTATLAPGELLEIAETLAAARRLREFLLRRADLAPSLAAIARGIVPLPELEDAVHAAIDDRAEVRDDASPALARWRRELRTLHQRLHDRLQRYLRQPEYRDMLQEPIVTVRGDRYCLPVKAEYRHQFPGLIHDQSASGATLFMEPQGVVELGNEWRHTQLREREEVERILRELSGRIGAHAEAIRPTLAILGTLDLIAARARLGHALQATPPQLATDGSLELRRARHPLLRGEVVPIDVRLGGEFRVLVITGPNTGGKTVCLKTVGLLALMAQAGLWLPAAAGSRLPVFYGIFADIGDEQSLQQSLSTFSGHLRQIARILDAVTAAEGHALVLLDEIGAGTDPAEGAALAKAILQTLLATPARCLVTTHYGELKEFAHATPGVENASVEFDPETLRPTYRLLIGIPGSSHAFAVARRLGLRPDVVEAAMAMMGSDRVALAGIIERLTASRRTAEAEEHRAAVLRAEVEAARAELERERRRLEGERRAILQRARAEADALVRQARAEVRRVMDALRAREKEVRRSREEAALTRLREAVRQAAAPLAAIEASLVPSEPEPPAESPAAPPIVPGDPEPGDAVWIGSLGQRGTLLEPPRDGRAMVQVGSARLTVPYAALQRIAAPARPSTARTSDLQVQARRHLAPELNLRGERVDEGLRRLDAYLDAACLAGLSPVRIIHGIGTGALRRAIWEHLKSHPHVADLRHAAAEEGGTGVTIVELRE